MTLWDSLTGQRPSSSSPSSSSVSPPSTTIDTAPSLTDSAPSTSFTADLTAPDASSILISNPYTDPSRLHPLANLNQDTLDYLTLEDSALSSLPGAQSALPSRGWSDDLCYGTGVTYLGALSLGGAWGLTEGLNRSPSNAPPKLRLNSVLNSVTRRGPFLGNSAGVIALVYNLVNSTIGHYRGRHDGVNSVVAGAVSGMLFKSTRGLRPMLISGGLVAGAAGAWAVTRKALF
ncbi:Mitochondrial import inner membrane translocase subunit tim23 [Xylographa vitiligo]|nr:Mitochondrial import inner membrane translocase subunit tim23 [Xylographa vitiligo]